MMRIKLLFILHVKLKKNIYQVPGLVSLKKEHKRDEGIN